MAIRIVFLGRLSDLAGQDEVGYDADGRLDWDGLLTFLQHLGPTVLHDTVAGDRVRVAVDGVVLEDKQKLSVRDAGEIALLPPVSGG